MFHQIFTIFKISLPNSTGRYSLYVMCCSSAMRTRRASWNNFSSFHCGFRRYSSSASRLCSRKKRVCMAVNPMSWLTLESPLTNTKIKRYWRQECQMCQSNQLYQPWSSVSPCHSRYNLYFASQVATVVGLGSWTSSNVHLVFLAADPPGRCLSRKLLTHRASG